MSSVSVRRDLLDRFYPIVPDAAWMARIAPLGVKTVQLRLKDADSSEVDRQIADCLVLARRHGCQLIVNDYWQAAIRAGADFVHLGQEDLAGADIAALRAAGIRIGISTHDRRELAIALAAMPDYIALGPVYETKLKVMKWRPQGLEKVRFWKEAIGQIPLVAIGGITPALADGVCAAGADSIAVITDFITAPDPEARVSAWVAWSASTA
ncbi:MAG: thiamine phosphate synthase [Hyphomicrobium sp.]